MNVSLAALRSRLLDLRSWDSSGETLNKRIKEALNLALDRLAGDVPEALIPDDEHVVVYKDAKATDSDVDARIKVFNADGTGVTGTDKIVMVFTDTVGVGLAQPASLTTWRPTFTGEWDGIMHLEITDSTGTVHRRQSREWFTYKDDDLVLWYAVTIDRPWLNNTDSLMKFRIHQPEFYFRDDVMELLEPARVYGNNRQQVWAIDTAGAHRQDMIDFQGESSGRPYRMWRGRHFQLPAPTEAPQVIEANSEAVEPNIGLSANEANITIGGADLDRSGWERDAVSGSSSTGSGSTVVALDPEGRITVGSVSSASVSSPFVGADLSVRSGATRAGASVIDFHLSEMHVDSYSVMNPTHRSVQAMSSSIGGTNNPDGTPVPVESVFPPPSASTGGGSTTALTRPSVSEYQWHDANTLRSGTWGVCYTYVWGRRDIMWQQSPLITPGGHDVLNNDDKLAWCYEPTASAVTGVNRFGGIHDPTWESAPSPVTVITQAVGGALLLSATNLDAMLGFGDSTQRRYSHTGMRIRYYVTHLSAEGDFGKFNGVETNQRYYLLCETESTFDHVAELTSAGVTEPSGVTYASSSTGINSARVVWNGDQLYDYHRPLKHSTGYYAWSVYPHQDALYELDLRVLRLPRKYVDDQDTAPIQRDAVPALIEMALHYISLLDGNDQLGAVQHLARYQELVRLYRQKYGSPGGIVEPVPLTGYPSRHRYGAFKMSD